MSIEGFAVTIDRPSELLRLGPDCLKMRDPYSIQVVATLDFEGYYVLQGAAGVVTWPAVMRAVAIINRKTGKPVRWYRLGPNPYQMRQIEGLNDGKRIKMSKEKLEFPKHSAHDVHPGRAGGNKIDRKKGVEIGASLLDALKSGRIQVASVRPPLPAGVTFDSVQAQFASGANVLTGVESTDVALDGQKRAQRVKLFYTLGTDGPAQTLELEYNLPD